MERNLRLYPWYTAAAGFHPASAVFYLFLAEHLSLDRLLQLEAIYYVAYVLFEVPSGYLSDRVGRRLTLGLGAAAGALGYGLFALGSSFAVFAAAQACLAVFWSFRSGSDTSLHYDSLLAAGRTAEYARRESRAQRNGLLASAASLLLGGALGMVSLRAPYVAGFAGALVPIGVVSAMCEPPRHGSATPDFARQLRACAALLRGPALRWLFALFVAVYALEHVPHTFYQPYLATLLGAEQALTPLASGVYASAAALVAALAAARSVALLERRGARAALLLLLALQWASIALMVLPASFAAALLLLGRNAPYAAADVVLAAATAPRVPSAQRATYLSIQGLAGRLGFALLLLGVSSYSAGHAASDPAAVRAALLGCLAVGFLAWAGLWLARAPLGPRGA